MRKPDLQIQTQARSHSVVRRLIAKQQNVICRRRHRTHFDRILFVCLCCGRCYTALYECFVSFHFNVRITICLSRSHCWTPLLASRSTAAFMWNEKKYTVKEAKKVHIQQHSAMRNANTFELCIRRLHIRIRCETHALSCQQNMKNKRNKNWNDNKKWSCLWALITRFNFSGC